MIDLENYLLNIKIIFTVETVNIEDIDMPNTDYWYIINIEEADIQKSGYFTLSRSLK